MRRPPLRLHVPSSSTRLRTGIIDPDMTAALHGTLPTPRHRRLHLHPPPLTAAGRADFLRVQWILSTVRTRSLGNGEATAKSSGQLNGRPTPSGSWLEKATQGQDLSACTMNTVAAWQELSEPIMSPARPLTVNVTDLSHRFRCDSTVAQS